MENRILLIDDEPNILAALRRVLMDEPYEILDTDSGEKGLEILQSKPCKVVISDERMPGMGGAEFLSRVKDFFPETVRILLTGYASIDAAMKAVNDGEIYRFFMKPWTTGSCAWPSDRPLKSSTCKRKMSGYWKWCENRLSS